MRVAGQLGLKSSRPESSRPWVNSARCILRAFSYIHVHDIRLGFCIIFRTKSKINIKKNIDKHCMIELRVNLLLD